MKKICLIGTVADSMLNFRRDFIVYLSGLNYVVYAFAVDYTPESRKMVEALGAVPVDYSLSRAGLNPVADVMSTLQLRKIIKKIKPDIVFSCFSKPVIFGTLAARLAGVPRIVGMLEGLGYAFTDDPSQNGRWKKRIVRWMQVWLYGIAFMFLSRIIFLNEDDPMDLVRKHRLCVKDVRVLGGIGVNLDEFPYVAPPTQPIRFIFIGRLLAEKGIHDFIAAARLVKQKHPDVKFIVLGGLDEENPSGLKKNALDSLLAKNLVVYPGHVPDVRMWLWKSSVFVLPSYREGVPRSAQEAMATGRAVITTDVPGCRDTIKDDENGFLVPVCSAGALAEKMMYLIDNPDSVVSMGVASRKWATMDFCADKQTRKLAALVLDDA